MFKFIYNIYIGCIYFLTIGSFFFPPYFGLHPKKLISDYSWLCTMKPPLAYLRNTRNQTTVGCMQGKFLTHWAIIQVLGAFL